MILKVTQGHVIAAFGGV